MPTASPARRRRDRRPGRGGGESGCCVRRRARPTSAVSRSAASSGNPGYCTSAAGVTVVVDMSALGGGVTVRCAPGPASPGFSGIDALHGAGFTVTGTQRYGLAFVCRIQGRPSAREPLAIPGNPQYREQCVNTPPQTAFWSYWYAPNGGSWTYSSVAAQSHDAIPGGFEGWAFSFGSARPAAPAVDPTRPRTKPTRSASGTTHDGTTTDDTATAPSRQARWGWVATTGICFP